MNAALLEFAAGVDRELNAEAARFAALPEIKKTMTQALRRADLMEDIDLSVCSEHYKRHLVYVDSKGRFSLLALVWAPGQYTPVHAHSAWGVVGVYRGRITEARFAKDDSNIIQISSYLCKEGEVTTIEPGEAQMHRLVNASSEPAVTLHCYGLSLREDPASINIVLAQ